MEEEKPLLFEHFPELRQKVDWVSLGEFPTPVHKLEGISEEEGIPELYIKRDDLSSPFYGGNKVRKLEFILAHALAAGHKRLVTFGGAGSNHVLATAIHARRLAIDLFAVMTPQPNAFYVRKNLLLDYYNGVRFFPAKSIFGAPFQFAKAMIFGFEKMKGGFPLIIPPGGSNILGSLGYVDSALELKQQIHSGAIPEPDFIFVAHGSGGTAAGLMVGVQVAGLKSKVVPVRVVDKYMCNRFSLARLANATIRFLMREIPRLDLRKINPAEMSYISDFAGETYAKFTPEAMEAVSKAKKLDDIKLEGTYTGKTLAGALDFIHSKGLEGKVCLFWNTYNSIDLYPKAAHLDFHLLPRKLQRYFETPTQEEQMGLPLE
ncbi:MAG: pyridoxal-phosphate dependent enzyme [Actinomycetota bacterium]|nr:pyridoxal-phosphate dependent enzyme [Actinomycetota bacterium]